MRFPNIETTLERPSEGTIARALPNTFASLTDPRKVAQLAGRKQVNMKFGSPGGVGSMEVEPGSFARTQEEGEDEAEWPGHSERRKAKA